MVVITRLSFMDCNPVPPANWLLESHTEFLSHVILEEKLSAAQASVPDTVEEEIRPVHQVEPDPECEAQPPQDERVKSEPIDAKSLNWCTNEGQLESDSKVVDKVIDQVKTVETWSDIDKKMNVDLEPQEVMIDKAVDIQITQLVSFLKKEEELKKVQLYLGVGRTTLDAEIRNFKRQSEAFTEDLEKKEQELEAIRVHLARKAASLEWLHTLVKDAERKYISTPKSNLDPATVHLGDAWGKLRNHKAALEAERQALDSLREEILNEINKIPKLKEDSQSLALVGAGDHDQLAMVFGGSSRKLKYIDMKDLLRSLPETAETAGLMKKYFTLRKATSLMAVEISLDGGNKNMASAIRLTSVDRQINNGVYEAYGFGDNQEQAFVNAFEQIYGAFFQDSAQLVNAAELALAAPNEPTY